MLVACEPVAAAMVTRGMAREQADQFLAGEAGGAGHGHADAGLVAPLVPFRFVHHLRVHLIVCLIPVALQSYAPRRILIHSVCRRVNTKLHVFHAFVVYTDSLGRIKMKAQRQSAILDVVEHEAVRSQEQLRQRLAARGFDVTQATLSRDIKELGLVKRSADGAYQPPSAEATPQPTALGTLRQARWPSTCATSTACSSWWCCAPARGRRSCWRSRSIARACRRWSARSPATTRFSIIARDATRALARASSS